LANQLGAYLVFSGGVTREGSALSEAESMFNVAEAGAWWKASEVRSRCLMEQNARDSLQNLVFGLAEIRRSTGMWPQELIAVGYAFKRARYELHASTLGIRNFTYVGVNDPHPDVLPYSIVGEYLKLQQAKFDPLLRSAEWRAQRESRNPLKRPLPDYSEVDQTLARFVEYAWGNGTMAPHPDW
jgi:hypothetical protein